MTLTDKNLFAYCDNNPVVRVDGDGEFWHILVGAAVGAVIGGVSKLITNLIENKEDVWDGIFISSLNGLASGALSATGIGLVGQIIGNVAIAMSGNAIQQSIDILQGEKNSFSISEMLIEGVIGAFGGLVGGSGASLGNSKSAMSYGIQLSKKIFNGKNIARGGSKYAKEALKALTYYHKNTVNSAGNLIYRELGRALAVSGGSVFVINSIRAWHSRCLNNV